MSFRDVLKAVEWMRRIWMMSLEDNRKFLLCIMYDDSHEKENQLDDFQRKKFHINSPRVPNNISQQMIVNYL